MSRAFFILPILQDGEVAPKASEGPRESAETVAVTPAGVPPGSRRAAPSRPSGVLPHLRWGRRAWSASLRKLTLATTVAAFAAACTTVPRFEAAGDIHEFLVAIRDGDQARFDAHVDRPALKVQLKSRLIAGQAAAHGEASWQTLGAALAGPLVDLGVDAYVQPQTFRAVALRLGYAPDKPIPGQIAIASSLRTIGDGDVCVMTKKDGPCTLVFKDESGVWKLIGYEGDLGSLMHRRH
jgi:hypothetical protein